MHTIEREITVDPDGDGVRVALRVHVRMHGSQAGGVRPVSTVASV